MNNKSVNIDTLQRLLHIWISKYESRSLESIKKSCDYLNYSYDLQLANPIWSIFWPLVYNGLVDHIGNGCYAITDPLIIDCVNHYYCINCTPKVKFQDTSLFGIYKVTSKPLEDCFRIVRTDSVEILKQFPSVDEVVDSFPKTLQDESNLEYYNWRTKRGIAKLEKDGLTRYFSIPEKLYIREIPNRNLNPEAFAISYCLSRVINEESNGKYYVEKKQLCLPTFAMPFNIYRTLLLESMKVGILPEQKDNIFIFTGISQKVVKELNRIFCKSISYE